MGCSCETFGDSEGVGGTAASMVDVGAGGCGVLVGMGVDGIAVGVGWEVAGTMVAVEAGDDSPPQAATTASAARMASRNDVALNARSDWLANRRQVNSNHCAALSVALS